MDLSQYSLDGKTALVTGGNSGIGLGIAKGLARAGARVAVCGRDPAKNDSALELLAAVREGCRHFVFDLAQTHEIDRFYAAVTETMGGIDILVNNAGIQCRGRADTIESDAFNRVLAVNLTAPFVLSQCFARERMSQSKGGSILLTASLMSEAARPTTAAYTASKGGIRQLVRALAVDWAPFGIRVNGLGPGYIHTPMTHALVEDPSFSRWVETRTPLGRWGTPDDLEGAAVFLVSDAAKFITGQILYVDGGWLATF